MRCWVYVRAGLILAMLGVAGPPLFSAAIDAGKETEIRAVLLRSGIAVERVRSRSEVGRVDLEGVSAHGPGWRLTVGRLRLASSPVAPTILATPALARSAVVTASDVAFSFGDVSVMIPELVARGTDLTPDDLSAFLHAGGIDQFKGMLPRLTATDVSAGAVLISIGEDVATARRVLDISDLRLTDVFKGHVGSLTAKDAAVVNADLKLDDEMRGIGSGAISLAGLDLPFLLDVLTGSRTDADTQLAPIFRSLTLGDLALVNDAGATFTFGRVALGALRARPLLVPPDDISRLFRKTEAERTPAGQEVLEEVLADITQSVVLDHLEVDRMAADGPPKSPENIRLGHLALDGLEPLRLRSLVVDGLSLILSGTGMSFDHAVLTGFDATRASGLLKHEIFGFGAPVAPNVGSLLPPRAALTVVGLKISKPVPPQGGMGALQPSDTPIDVPFFTIEGGIDPATGTMSSHAQVQVAYDVNSDPSTSALRQYGITRLDSGAEYGLTYDPKARALTVDRFAFEAANLGSFSLVARFGDVAPEVFRLGQSPDAALKTAQGAVFRSLSCTVVNAGIVEKVMPQLAAAAKVSVPLFRAQLKAQTEISLTQALGPGPSTQRLIAEIRTFIDTPKSLNLSVSAPNGLPIGTALAARDLKTLLPGLDIKAEANR